MRDYTMKYPWGKKFFLKGQCLFRTVTQDHPSGHIFKNMLNLKSIRLRYLIKDFLTGVIACRTNTTGNVGKQTIPYWRWT